MQALAITSLLQLQQLPAKIGLRLSQQQGTGELRPHLGDALQELGQRQLALVLGQIDELVDGAGPVAALVPHDGGRLAGVGRTGNSSRRHGPDLLGQLRLPGAGVPPQLVDLRAARIA